MARGENKAFKKEQSKAPPKEFQEIALYRRLWSFTSDQVDVKSFDLKSLIDSSCTVSENWENIKSRLEGVLDKSEQMDKELLENELERYDYILKKHYEDLDHDLEIED